MIASTDRLLMLPQEYLTWEEQQQWKHEYLNGEAYAMVGGTLNHNVIAVNLVTLLRSHLRGTNCRVFVNDVMVQAHKDTAYFYPNLVVTCDPEDLKAKRLIQSPYLIVEVLSPGTEGYDRGEKFKQYRKLSSLQEYVLVNAETKGVECYRLNKQRKWELNTYFPEEAIGDLSVEFASIEFACPLDLVYEDVEVTESASRVISRETS